MATSLTLEPDAFTLAKNQILFRAQTDKYVINAGVPFTTSLFLDAVLPADGETLIITIFGIDFTYTFKDAVTPGSCYDIDRAGGVGVDMQANMFAMLKKNFYLERFYNVGNGTGIQAKQAGSEFDLSFAGTAPMVHVVTNSTPRSVRSDLSIVWDIYEGEDSTDEPSGFVVSQALRPDYDQKIYPDVHELTQKRLSPDVPVYASDAVQYNVESLKKFMIRFGDQYDGQVQCYEKSSVFRAMLAGIALDRWAFVNFSGVYSAGISGQKFLTNLPRTMVLDRATQIFLSILVDADFDVLVDIDWDNGTSTNGVAKHNVVGNTKSMAIIPVGFDTLDLISLIPVGASYPLQFELYVQQGGGESEHITFLIHDKHKLYPRRFIFHNSLNGWDSLWCYGYQGRAVNNIGDDFDLPTPRDFKASTTELLLISSNRSSDDPTHVRVFELNTGHHTKEFIQALARELSLSQKVLLDTGSAWQEVKIDKSSIKEIDNDSEDLWSLTFSYSIGFTDNSF